MSAVEGVELTKPTIDPFPRTGSEDEQLAWEAARVSAVTGVDVRVFKKTWENGNTAYAVQAGYKTGGDMKCQLALIFLEGLLLGFKTAQDVEVQR